jgi:hypothetical protein
MKPEEVKDFLIGKTIKDIEWHKYIWPMCVDSIFFTDGTVVELGGNADYARIDSIQIGDEWRYIDDKDL